LDTKKMWIVIRKLALGFSLITVALAILLISDWHQRRTVGGKLPRLAIVQHSAAAALDEGVRGVLDSLKANGLIDGKNISIERFNADNDFAVANAIAEQVVAARFDMIVTISTLSLQTVAKANSSARVIHVFGIVADPFRVGVGIGRKSPLDHPKRLVGVPTPLPVAESFRLARKLFPGLQSVGVVWNPSEANSEITTMQAREICRELRIDLREAHVDSSAAVAEAAAALTAQGVQAIWVGGDNTVTLALDSVVSAARKARIPVFSAVPTQPNRGTLLDIGTNFYDAGRMTGNLASEILGGVDAATIPIPDKIPQKLVVNKQALKGLKDPWVFPEEVLAKADVLIDENGVHGTSQGAIRKPPEGRIFKVGLVYFAPEPGADACMEGLFSGLKDLGFVQGKNLQVRKAHAQGEIINIPSILQNFDNEDLDLIIPMSTPVLTAAINAVKKKPVVFTYVYDPVAAGAGKTPADHLPNITGTGSFPPVEETIDAIQKLVPQVRSVGTLYNSSEANSSKVVSVARELFQKRGIRLEEVTATNTGEVFQAAQVLAGRTIQALWVTGDNTAIQAFEGIAKVAADSRLPLVINDPEFTERGALAAVGIGWKKTCYEAAKRVAQVLLGESPQALPFENIALKQVVLNYAVARKLGITFPPELVQEASRNM
jgi:putative tryptophan/tyrosine transport system substrate-binding protein